ncbi:tetratricopeptide repeat protein [Acidisphaera sp. S103]|uniref:tetratricopeptide repeat protein n=1 Tax=Acidisphaera sp. S103 TaxID=1747223 RepID=UPI00131D6C9F|nr:tetratricopeptide repeat protein [Acidisphaera sp. S103]
MTWIEDLLDRALADHQAGRLDAAEQGYREVLTADPVHADALHLLGVLAHQSARTETAIELIERAIALRPDTMHFHNNLGNILRDTGRAADAVACYRRALALNPDTSELHHNLAKALLALGTFAEAEIAFRRALDLDPDRIDTWNDFGNLLTDTGQNEAAIACFSAVLSRRPDDARAYNNLGRALVGQDRYAEAVQQFSAALRVKPDYVNAWFNLGSALDVLRQWDGAANCWQKVLELAPDDAEAHVSRALMLLKVGRLKEGWPGMQWFRYLRWKNDDNLDMEFPLPTWNGEDIGDQPLVLYADQGLGDAIQFCRYVSLCARYARIILVVPRSLHRLFTQLEGVSDVVSGPPLPQSYVHCPLSELPRIFETDLGNIPTTVPYLWADRQQSTAWRERFAPLTGLRVGLVWAGNPKYLGDRKRSIPLERLVSSVNLPGLHLISLQKGEAAHQIQPLQGPVTVHNWMDEVEDLASTAALIDGLDLVVGVDTGVIHLAAALGKPVWLLNRLDTDWRWLLDREDSPWYPTLRLFRQARAGDWEEPLRRLREELRRLAARGEMQPPSRQARDASVLLGSSR